ncbi:HI0074 family nucleotidyltransferase substrate-binding subunit [Candidatus Halobeggiatoa sp. HSG11]|nr:HI0074 family nucleotidyltransferase substrate-binding subunit [Candidatus Halobeggiatoa sp. HSG11]
MENIRWIQRLNNFKKAFKQLELGVEQATVRDLSDLEKEGLIQRFEYNQELSWQAIKDFYECIGETGIQGSRDAFQLAVNRGLIDVNCGKVLMESIKSRNVHTYNQETADEIFHDILNKYYQAFSFVKEALEKECSINGEWKIDS